MAMACQPIGMSRCSSTLHLQPHSRAVGWRLQAASSGRPLPSTDPLSCCSSTVHTPGTGTKLPPGRSRVVVCRNAAHETPEQAYSRRVQESLEVESRVINIYNERDFLRELGAAGDKLVLLEVQSENVCETGLFEEPEETWKHDEKRRHEMQMQKCVQIKSIFQRTARSCSDVTFLALEADGSEGANSLCDKLGIEILPTVQFYRNGKLLWQMAGTQTMQDGAALGDGVLYYGNAMADGASTREYVHEVSSWAELDAFTAPRGHDDKVLKVLDVSLSDGLGCIKVYPAVVALAKSFAGYADFGRLLGDASAETRDMLRALNILEVPTFIFYRGGKEVGRHVGSSRGDLIGQILQVQAAAGISPPPPPSNAPRRSFRKKSKASA